MIEEKEKVGARKSQCAQMCPTQDDDSDEEPELLDFGATPMGKITHAFTAMNPSNNHMELKLQK